MLVAAENPVIVAGRVARTLKGHRMVGPVGGGAPGARQGSAPADEFSELASAYADPGVLPLTPSVADADVILGLEVQDLYAITHQMTPINRFGMESRPTTKPGAKIITDFGRRVESQIQPSGFRPIHRKPTSRSPATPRRRCLNSSRP